VTHPLRSPTALVLYGLAALIAVPYALPAALHVPFAPALSAGRLRLLSPRPPDAAEPARPLAKEPTAVGASALVTDTNDSGDRDDGTSRGVAIELPPAPKRPIEDEGTAGRALVGFFARLAKTEAKQPGARTRILYFGDSVIAADWITSTLRRDLQHRFGDAGHGYVLPANAWPGYFHQDIARFASEGWKASRVVGPFEPNGIYGLGGVTLVAEGPGSFATVATIDPASKLARANGGIGTAVSRFVVTYRQAADGGTLQLSVDGQPPVDISTRAEKPSIGSHSLTVPDGRHKLTVRSQGGGPVGVLGVDVERDEPGVIVDSLGIVGCRLRFLGKFAPEIFAENLQSRDPALLVFSYGANESEDGFAYPMADYERTAREVLQRARQALPTTSCLLVGPMDRADKKGDSYATRPVIPELNRIQRQLAKELGCAFFDTFEAMGGRGSMGVWVQRGLGGKDLVHPTNEGAAVLAGYLEEALLAQYARFRAEPAASESAETKPEAAP
jgi:lysophospholipase L1-like esterase